MPDGTTANDVSDVVGRYNQLPPPDAEAQFQVTRQNASNLHNVAGDQYNQYLQTVHAQRESFLRDIAANRTKSRRRIWWGFLIFLAGFGTYFVMVVRLMMRMGDHDVSGQEFFEDMWGEEIGGVPIVFIGFGVAMAGIVMLIVGLVGHVVAASRQRRLESQPIFPPGPPNGPFPPTTGRLTQ